MLATSSVIFKRVLGALIMVVALIASTLALAPDNASSMTGPTLSITARGVDGTETLVVKRNGSTVGSLAFGTSNSAQSIILPVGSVWTELELQFNDSPGRDLIVLAFSLDGESRSMVQGDVLVSGQWTGTSCSSLGPPIGETIHCNGIIQFPASGGNPDPPNPPGSGLDPSYWGNAQTVVPVYDTAWPMGASVTLAQAEEYMDFLVDVGFSGFATTYLGNIHAPAQPPGENRYVHKDPLGNSIAEWDNATGNLIMDPDHADHFEDILDLAHDRGLRVMLLVVWERKIVEELGLLNESNGYNWGQQIGARFKDHPAIQAWTLGGDAGVDTPRTQFWTNVTNGLTDAGVTGDMNFHTGSSQARRVNQIDAPWNTGQLIMTSHCADTELATSRLNAVQAQSSIPVWIGEPRYEGIFPTWCGDNPYVPTAQDIVDDALSFVNNGAAGLFYGHNERWQWGHGLEGSTGQGWAGVQQSFDAPGAYALIDALTGTPPPPPPPPEPDVDPPVVTSLVPTDGASVVAGSIAVAAAVSDAESGVNRVQIYVRKLSTGEYWNGSAWVSSWSWVLASNDGAGSWSIPGVDLSDAGDYLGLVWAWDAEGNLANYSSNPQSRFTVGALDEDPPVVASVSPSNGTTVASGDVDVAAQVADAGSGVDRVQMYVRKNSTGEYWNGTAWVSAWSWVAAADDGAGSWSIPDVDMSDAGTYRVLVWAWDREGNRANYSDNPQSLVTVESDDVDPPEVSSVSPQDGAVVPSGVVDVSAQVTDVGSGVDRVRILIRKNSTGEYWNGSDWTANWSWVMAVDDGLGSWVVPEVDVSDASTYRVLAWAWDGQNNRSNYDMNPASLFTVTPDVI